MTYNIEAYEDDRDRPTAIIEQLKIKRDWIPSSAYHCTPMALANTFGYGVYFDKDISFIWDGDNDHPAKGLLGKEIISEVRGGGTVSFNTNLLFKTDENTSLLTMPVPNQVIEGATVLTNLLSTSFFSSNIPVVWKIHEANKEYYIPAGTYLAALIPISLGQFKEVNININSGAEFDKKPLHQQEDYIAALKNGHKEGKFLRLYERGLNHLGEKVGFHEVENFKMTVKKIDRSKND